MRPTKLVMNAFGPYRGKVELDFTDFGASSIFLITGPTGAGKTTIFDAITYALFNQASGDMRETEMLKSQFATDQDKCFVELTFDVGTDEYRVKRSPKQMGPGARVKTRELSASVELYKEDKPLATSISEANNKIQHLLGLSYEQFCQIVMLPQGDFRELLQSNSGEKEEIFRSIFGTEHIQHFQNLLKDKRRALQKEFEAFENRLEQSVASIEDSDHTALQAAIEQMDFEKTLELLEERITEGQAALKETRKAIEDLTKEESKTTAFKQLLEELATLEETKKALDERQPEVDAQREALDLHKKAAEVNREQTAYEQLVQAVETAAEELAQKKKEQTENAKELDTLQEKEVVSNKEVEQLGAVREQIQDLKEALKTFRELEEKQEQLKKQQSEWEELTQKLNKNKEQETAFEKQIKEIKADLVKIEDWKEDLKIEEKKQAELKETTAALEKEKETLEKILDSQETLAEVMAEEKRAKAAYKMAESAYQEARAHYFGNLAGVLAQALEEAEPCPVCGSTQHPNPALAGIEAVSDEELAELENKQNREQTAYTKASAAVEQVGSHLQEQIALLKEETGNYKETLSEKETSLDEATDDLRACEPAIAALEEQIEQEKDWREQLEEIREQRDANTVEQTTQQANAEHLKTANHTLEAVIKELAESVPYESDQAVQKEIDTHNETIQRVEEAAQEISSALSENKRAEASLSSAIEVLTKRQQSDEKAMQEQKERLDALLKKYAFDASFDTYLLAKEKETAFQQSLKAFENEQLIYRNQWETANDKWAAAEDARSISALEKALAGLEEEKQALEAKRDDYVAQNKTYESSHQQIHENYTAYKEILEPLQVYEELAEVANGSTKRTSYVSFERYVLSIYFEEVLAAANHRFETMTNGRYEMVRREDRTKGRGAEGLEIDVFDRYAGDTRSVKTLSGGETFKASLALALGLSDVIQNEQGGVHVDTLFVDEGFGTLDADSLEMAIETLMELQSTGRLIGIISHVAELKDRIPAKIVVENKKEGSHSRIEVN